MKKCLLFLVIVIVAVQAFGLVAYSGMNDRNHPELKWKSLTTTNCQIIYHDPLLAEATETAQIAQNTFDALCKSYEIEPKTKCIIYVSDQDNIPNGATVFNYYIFIWVNQNDFTTMFTGNDKWIRKVVAHEMSHWFVSTSIRDWMSPIFPVSSLSFPHSLNEGYAQFFSGEPWGYNRGDRFLKASILSQTADTTSPMYEGGLLYGAGFSMVRYIDQVYGEKSLAKLLNYRSKAKMYDFKEAFEDVFHKSYKDFTEEWRRYVATYYYGEVYNAKAADSDTTSIGNINDFTKLKTEYCDLSKLDWKKDNLLLLGRKTKAQKYYDLVLAKVLTDSLSSNKLKLENPRKIVKYGSMTSISLSDNGKWIAYCAYSRHNKGRMAPRVFKYDVASRKLKSFGEGNLAAIDSLGGIYYQALGKSTNDIYYIKPDLSIFKWLSLNSDDQISNIKLSPDNSKLAVTVFDHSKEFHIFILDTASASIMHTITLQNMPQSILWSTDLDLIYTVENAVDFSLDIFQRNLDSGVDLKFSDNAYNAIPLRYIDDKLIGMAEFKRGGAILGYFKPEIKATEPMTFSENYYNKWIMAQPQYTISNDLDSVLVSQPVRYNSLRAIKWRGGLAIPTYNSVIGGFVVSEALGKHVLGGAAYLPYSSRDKAWWTFMYLNQCYDPAISVIYARYQWLSGLKEDKLYYQDIDEVAVSADFPITINRPFTFAKFNIGWKYDEFHNVNANPIFKSKNFSSFVSSLGYGYNLPWENSVLHPVCAFNLDYSLQAATDKLAMNMDFDQHTFKAGLVFAPLLHSVKSEQLRTIAFENRSTYEFVNGDQIDQLLPGTDHYAILQANNKPAFRRYYLRGYEDDHLCKKILNVQNQINVKLTDDLKFGLGWDDNIVSTGYAGVSLWHDYTVLKDVLAEANDQYTYQASGFEVKVETSILGIETVLKYGIAYDKKFEKLADYFLIDIPLLSSFNGLMGVYARREIQD
ncbi:MAG: hypothetical protein CVU48_03340 [Candidatus Cloacimonetes bacterium HGW-Cloacimonetes-1]|jgi:hypothetical protein|nr:MAG: hypothetical protein CVU48_03340 [Candidatus Cloacimonetes bacterium HGW-Cloacimonetes-1]